MNVETEVLQLSPYLVGYAYTALAKLNPLLVRRLVVPLEPLEERRPALETRCLFVAAAASLLSLGVTSWASSLLKVVLRLSNPSASHWTPAVLMGSLAVYVALGIYAVALIGKIHPDSYGGAKRRFMLHQVAFITVGLVIDVVARHL